MNSLFKEKGVYKITNKINGKIYIGSTFSNGGFEKRWYTHKNLLKRNKHYNKILQNSWNKYGEDSFEFEIIEIVLTKEDILIKEQYYLDLFKSYENGYNVCRIVNSTLGIKLSDETKTKMSNSKFGHSTTTETKNKISLKLKNIKHSDLRRKNISNGKIGKPNINCRRKVLQLRLNGEFIKEWGSIITAEDQLKISHIGCVCRGVKKTAGGYKWKYKDEIK